MIALQQVEVPTLYPVDLFTVGIAGFLLAVAMLIIAERMWDRDRQDDDDERQQLARESAGRSTVTRDEFSQ